MIQNQHRYGMTRTTWEHVDDKAVEIDKEKKTMEGECRRKCCMTLQLWRLVSFPLTRVRTCIKMNDLKECSDAVIENLGNGGELKEHVNNLSKM